MCIWFVVCPYLTQFGLKQLSIFLKCEKMAFMSSQWVPSTVWFPTFFKFYGFFK